MLPLHIYRHATNDEKLEKVKRVQSSLVAYCGSRIKVIRHFVIRVWRGDASYLLDCCLVDNKEIRSILGRKAYLGMDIIQYDDNDSLNKPQTGDAAVFMVQPSPQSMLTQEEMLAKFPSVFSDRMASYQENTRFASILMLNSSNMHLAALQ